MTVERYRYDAENIDFYNHVDQIRKALNTVQTNQEARVGTSVQIVRTASDLSGTLSSENVYIIDGEVDMGDQSILVPAGGLRVTGYGFGVSNLKSSADNFTLFVDDGNYSGDLFLDGLDIQITGSGSKVFDLDNAENSNAIECGNTNFLFCTSLGDLRRYRQGLWNNVGVIFCDDGLTLHGTWAGGMTALTSIVVGPFDGILFKAGDSLLIEGSFRSDMNALQMGTYGLFTDLSPSNIVEDAGFSMEGVRVPQDGEPAFPNMPASSVKARFRQCTGTPNTYPGATATVTTSATATISTSDTLVDIAGALTFSELAWFQANGDFEFEYIGSPDISVTISGVLSFSASNNNVIALQIRKWNAALQAYENLGPEFTATTNGGAAGDRAENLPFEWVADLKDGDRIGFQVKNVSATQNITTLTGGAVRIVER